MTGDHHGRTAKRATLLVTATDEILGTYTHRRSGDDHTREAQMATGSTLTGDASPALADGTLASFRDKADYTAR
jgi:hypothetical protein